jgi:hypothetical protein
LNDGWPTGAKLFTAVKKNLERPGVWGEVEGKMNLSKLESTIRSASGADSNLDRKIASTLHVTDRDFTSSVDACLDLLHEKLPTTHWHVGRTADGVGVYAFLEDGDVKCEAEAVTVPLALLAVIIQGLED